MPQTPHMPPMSEAATSPPVFLESLPPWAAELVRTVTAKQANTFVLHGVPADLVPVRDSAGLRFLSRYHLLSPQLLPGRSSPAPPHPAAAPAAAHPAPRHRLPGLIQRH